MPASDVGEDCLLVLASYLLTVFSRGRKRARAPWSLIYKGTNPSLEVSTSYDIIASQRPHLPTPCQDLSVGLSKTGAVSLQL